jgi:hypothetical protein
MKTQNVKLIENMLSDNKTVIKMCEENLKDLPSQQQFVSTRHKPPLLAATPYLPIDELLFAEQFRYRLIPCSWGLN